MEIETIKDRLSGCVVKNIEKEGKTIKISFDCAGTERSLIIEEPKDIYVFPRYKELHLKFVKPEVKIKM